MCLFFVAFSEYMNFENDYRGSWHSPNVSTTPLRQWGFRQCLPFSWTALRGKHCRHPIAIMGVVYTFWHYATAKSPLAHALAPTSVSICYLIHKGVNWPLTYCGTCQMNIEKQTICNALQKMGWHEFFERKLWKKSHCTVQMHWAKQTKRKRSATKQPLDSSSNTLGNFLHNYLKIKNW